MTGSSLIKRSICLLFLILSMVTVTSCASQGVTSIEETGSLPATAAAEQEQDMAEVPEDTLTDAGNDDTVLVNITMKGGTGKAYIESPVTIDITEGNITAHFIWSSKNYDYMIVDGVRYDNENPGGASTFTVPVSTLDEPLKVIGDTTAMSTPHEIEYTIFWGDMTAASKTGTDDLSQADSEDGGEGEDAGTDTGDTSFDPNSFVDTDIPELPGLEKTGEYELKYASRYTISKYGDYVLINIKGVGNYLLVPEDKNIPDDLPGEVTVLKQPLDKTYLVSTSAMDLICKCGCLDSIIFTGTKEDEWYVDEARTAMHEGRISYAGKYRAPDYELILAGGTNLAIENTMIYHEPEVKEKLEELGIPVIVETSSYEDHPLGRLEWIKFYGMLYGKYDEACKFYESQLKLIEPVINKADTGKSVGFFHVSASGLINVRKPGDYISKMIDLAGGEYIIKGDVSESGNNLSSMNMQMEDFYAAAREADIMIYNSTIAGEISNMDELTAKNALFADFKAVKEGEVYCTGQGFFQQTTNTAMFVNDLNAVLNGEDTGLVYLKKLK